MSLSVLFITEDQQLGKDISFYLQIGYPELAVAICNTEQKADKYMASGDYDLIIIDTPAVHSEILGFINKIRQYSNTLLLFLSEGETDIERAKGLEAGVDEYVSKPFSPIEFLARCKALLRRTKINNVLNQGLISVDGLTINLQTCEVYIAGQQIKLTPKEYKLLAELVQNQGKIISQRELLEKVWGPEYIGDYHLVKSYIYRLRGKLHNCNKPNIIVNERGFGYRIEQESNISASKWVISTNNLVLK